MRPEDVALAEDNRPVVPSGGQAFPNVMNADWKEVTYGMSLRDYFAAKAIGGMLADPNIRDMMNEFVLHAPRQAYAIADAMIAERAKVIEST